jgi:hypothetical protein
MLLNLVKSVALANYQQVAQRVQSYCPRQTWIVDLSKIASYTTTQNHGLILPINLVGMHSSIDEEQVSYE